MINQDKNANQINDIFRTRLAHQQDLTEVLRILRAGVEIIKNKQSFSSHEEALSFVVKYAFIRDLIQASPAHLKSLNISLEKDIKECRSIVEFVEAKRAPIPVNSSNHFFGQKSVQAPVTFADITRLFAQFAPNPQPTNRPQK